MSDDSNTTPRGTRLFQVNEDDLATLEQCVPDLVDRLYCKPDLLDTAIKMKIRRVQRIITDIRWDYGPPDSVEVIPAAD